MKRLNLGSAFCFGYRLKPNIFPTRRYESLSDFSTIIDRYYASNTRIVLAFSGGVDSRVLLDLLAQYKDEKQADCLAVYVHHGLSSNADDWLAQCQTWAIQSGIDFIAEHVQLNTNGESLEACAREARYQALRQHLDANDLLLTGQHSDDQVETFCWHSNVAVDQKVCPGWGSNRVGGGNHCTSTLEREPRSN